MTKYLIIFLIVIIIIMVAVLFFFNPNRSRSGTATPPPLVQFSPSPTTSPSSTPIPFEEQARAQTEADKNFSQWDTQTKADYPWLDKLPVTSSNYYANFDIGEKQFIVTIFQDASNPFTDQQIAVIKTEVQSKLKNLIPDYAKYNIEWQIKSR